MDTLVEPGLVELSIRGETIDHRPILIALWRRCLKRYKGKCPNRFGEARAYAHLNGYRKQRTLIVLHCIEAEYNNASTCEQAAAALLNFLDHKRLPHSLLRIYETKVLGKR